MQKIIKVDIWSLDVCAENPCSNGGTCVEKNGTANCSCPSGFVGKYCETKGAFNIEILRHFLN